MRTASLVKGLALGHAPKVALGDEAFAFAHLDLAPAAVTLLDPADDAGLGMVTDRRIGIALHMDIARSSRFDDRRPPIAQ